MRRMLFGTMMLPGAIQYIELAHPFWRFAHCGLSSVRALLYDRKGRALVATDLPLDRNLVDLRNHFPSVGEPALALFDVAYDLKGKQHPYQYGYIYQDIPQATPIHYPLDPALGLTDAINYSPNFGYFPLGPLPAWLGIQLYLGNVSEWTTIEPEVQVVTSQGSRIVKLSLPPLSNQVLEVEGPEAGEILEYLAVKTDNKPVCYVAGVDRRTGALAFLEHLMQTFKMDGEFEPTDCGRQGERQP
jgi:hypothetical protein